MCCARRGWYVLTKQFQNSRSLDSKPSPTSLRRGALARAWSTLLAATVVPHCPATQLPENSCTTRIGWLDPNLRTLIATLTKRIENILWRDPGMCYVSQSSPCHVPQPITLLVHCPRLFHTATISSVSHLFETLVLYTIMVRGEKAIAIRTPCQPQAHAVIDLTVNIDSCVHCLQPLPVNRVGFSSCGHVSMVNFGFRSKLITPR